MEQGWDPGVKRFFTKVLNSIGVGLLWMMTMVGFGLYAGFAIPGEWAIGFTIGFYVLFAASIAFLVFYFVKVWSKRDPGDQ